MIVYRCFMNDIHSYFNIMQLYSLPVGLSLKLSETIYPGIVRSRSMSPSAILASATISTNTLLFLKKENLLIMINT